MVSYTKESKCCEQRSPTSIILLLFEQIYFLSFLDFQYNSWNGRSINNSNYIVCAIRTAYETEAFAKLILIQENIRVPTCIRKLVEYIVWFYCIMTTIKLIVFAGCSVTFPVVDVTRPINFPNIIARMIFRILSKHLSATSTDYFWQSWETFFEIRVIGFRPDFNFLFLKYKSNNLILLIEQKGNIPFSLKEIVKK